MAKLNGRDIQKLAIQLVQGYPQGVRYSDLVRLISQPNPETPVNSIHGAVWNLSTLYPKQVSKPARGLFVPVVGDGGEAIGDERAEIPEARAREEDFYSLFAEYLQNDLDECTKAVALGGSVLRSKWGTPDVVGVYRPLKRDLVQFPIEIVAAEIKIDANQPVTAFGQSVAYRLFAARTYLVEPTSIQAEDLGRLEALCMLFGVGLVLYETVLPEPSFSIRMRAQRFIADMFYVNQFAERLKEYDPDVFDELFG